jgi:hypothetical protein
MGMESVVNPVRNSSRFGWKPSGASDSAGIILGPNPTAGEWGIISNGVNDEVRIWKRKK